MPESRAPCGCESRLPQVDPACLLEPLVLCSLVAPRPAASRREDSTQPVSFLQVPFQGQEGPLLPGDLVTLQHDAGPGALLHCSPALGPPGPEAPYLSAVASAWLAHLPAQLEVAPTGPACALRLLAATERLTPLLGLRPNPGLRRPGHYEVRATVGNSVSMHNLSCDFDVLSPVAGLRVAHPTPHDGRLYVPTNGSVLVLRVDSGTNATATAHWPGGNVSAPFEAACPAPVAALVPSCALEANTTLFSVLALPGLREGEHTVEVVVENSAGQANLSLQVKAEEPICGLRATPSPEARVLQGVLVVSEAGKAARGWFLGRFCSWAPQTGGSSRVSEEPPVKQQL